MEDQGEGKGNLGKGSGVSVYRGKELPLERGDRQTRHIGKWKFIKVKKKIPFLG